MYRQYNDLTSPTVKKLYYDNHTSQTLQHVLQMKSQLHQFTASASVWKLFHQCALVHDASDPDAESQLQHSLQTAEALKTKFPTLPWLHLTGFLHDLGKCIALRNVPIWSIVGDTFPVGCAFSHKVVFPEYFVANPDRQHSVLSSKYGIYWAGCGLSNVHFSYGHDEWLATMLEANDTKLPPQAINIIRYHSFYAWHRSGAYHHLCNQRDMITKEWVQRFSLCDLYSKDSTEVDVETLLPYYQRLAQQYLPPLLKV